MPNLSHFWLAWLGNLFFFHFFNVIIMYLSIANKFVCLFVCLMMNYHLNFYNFFSATHNNAYCVDISPRKPNRFLLKNCFGLLRETGESDYSSAEHKINKNEKKFIFKTWTSYDYLDFPRLDCPSSTTRGIITSRMWWILKIHSQVRAKGAISCLAL